MLKKTDAETREMALKETLAEIAKDLARIANETPMTAEQAEEITRRSI